MKMIVATIRPVKFPYVKDALAHLRLDQMTVYTVTGCENWDATNRYYGGNEVESDLAHKTRVEIAAADENVAAIVHAIRKAANTGNPGDGTISVYTIEQSIKIRTGEEGPTAL